ncbi:MAG: AAA family ATPase [Paracoccaceae bacterium]
MSATVVDPELTRVRVDPAVLDFETTADCTSPVDVPAQERAMDAIAFGAAARGAGFNIFAMGRPGLGRRAALREAFADSAAEAAPGDDWVYVYNFAEPHRPRALRLPFGTATRFRDAMSHLVEDLAAALPAAFESDDYKTRRNAIEAAHQTEQEERLGDLRARAAEQDLALVRTPIGFAFMPSRDGEVVKPEVFKTWAEADRERVQEAVEALQEELAALFKRDLPALERRTRKRIRELDREVAEATIADAVAEVAAAFEGIDPILEHVAAVARDLVAHFHVFVALDRAGEGVPPAARLEHPMLRRYAVNVMDAPAPDGTRSAGAPIVEEPDPTFVNLVGRIEHQPHEGALITDFTMIKPGALHRANGGFLILEARDVLSQPFAWEALKRCLKTGAIRIGSVAERVNLISTVTLEPEEIPLSVRVALIGERRLLYLLSALDPDFPSLFKVQADFDDDVERSEDALRLMGRAVAAAVRREDLAPFDREAVAAVLEEASRLSDDAAKLTLRIEPLADLLSEADHRARSEGDGTVRAAHVLRAVEARRRRADRLPLLGVEMADREIVRIETDGEAVGQINGLSVISIGETRFGRPARITAQVRMGAGKIVDIEREAKLGGPLHSKGVLILSSFLATRFGRSRPVSLWAGVVFEQSYGGVDGDSASSTELYALLSALAEAPIRQSLAVTGSVDQFGRVQAIGGVNEKIEGFFDLCAARGLTGGQGVLIPASNVQHLNLRRDVADAVADGRFTIHAVTHVDEGVELLTGVPAGVRDSEGSWPEDSMNGRVAARLAEFGETMQELARRERAAPGADEEET